MSKGQIRFRIRIWPDQLFPCQQCYSTPIKDHKPKIFAQKLGFANVSQEISLPKHIMSCLLMFHSSQALIYELTGQKNRKSCKKLRRNIANEVFLWSIVSLRRIMCGMCETLLARTLKWWTPCRGLAWTYSGTWESYSTWCVHYWPGAGALNCASLSPPPPPFFVYIVAGSYVDVPNSYYYAVPIALC
jgi:hypothetical protein